MGRNNIRQKNGGRKFKKSRNKSDQTEEEIYADMVAALIVKVKLSDTAINEKYEDFMATYPKGKSAKRNL